MKKQPKIEEYKWAIAFQVQGGRYAFYYGTFGTKKEAIKEHCAALGDDWPTCVKNGDICVRVKMTTT